MHVSQRRPPTSGDGASHFRQRLLRLGLQRSDAQVHASVYNICFKKPTRRSYRFTAISSSGRRPLSAVVFSRRQHINSRLGIMLSLLSTILTAALAASAVRAQPAPLVAAHDSVSDPIGPFPLKLEQNYVKVSDGVLQLSGDAAEKTEFIFHPLDSSEYNIHGTIPGYMGAWTETFGSFSPATDVGQCVQGVSNTTRATHYTLEPCSKSDSDADFGLQLFHLISGSQFVSPPQNQNFTTDWIPFGEEGDTQPQSPGAYGSRKPLDGWRFYARTSDGVRLQAQPKANGVGTTLRFLNESTTASN